MQAVSPVITLNYQRPPPTPARDTLRWLWFALSMPAAVVPFLPFTWDTSPLEAIAPLSELLTAPSLDGFDLTITLLGLPFFLAFAVTLLRLRLILPWAVSRVGSWAAGLLAIPCALGTSYIVFVLIDESPGEWVACLAAGLACFALAGGTLLLVFNRRRVHHTHQAIVALQSASLANAAICLLAFRDDPEAGYYLAMIACGFSLLDVVWITLCSPRPTR